MNVPEHLMFASLFQLISRIGLFRFRLLAGLVADRAGCLARGLAGRLALAASALFQRILKIS